MEKKEESKFLHLTLLSMMYATILQISVLLDYKFILIGSLVASSATFIISITFFITDIIAEVYGYQKAKEVSRAGIIGLVCFSCIGFFLGKIPSPHAYHHYTAAYHTVLDLLIRSGLSNAAALMIGSHFNIYFVSRWKKLLKGKYFWLRSLGASIIGEAFYTIFVVTLVNIGIVTYQHYIEILLISYCYKLGFDLFAVIPSSLLASFLKKREKINAENSTDKIIPFLKENMIRYENFSKN